MTIRKLEKDSMYIPIPCQAFKRTAAPEAPQASCFYDVRPLNPNSDRHKLLSTTTMSSYGNNDPARDDPGDGEDDARFEQIGGNEGEGTGGGGTAGGDNGGSSEEEAGNDNEIV